MAFTKSQIAIAVALIGAAGVIVSALVTKPSEGTAVEYTGIVTDQHSKALQNAKVTLVTQGPPRFAYTDVNGVYRIKESRVPRSAEARIKVESEGYEPYLQNLADSSNTRIEDIRLRLSSDGALGMNEVIDRDMTIQIDLCAFDRGNERVVECVTHGACRGPGSLGLGFAIDKTSKESAIYTCKQSCVSEAKSRNATCNTPPPF